MKEIKVYTASINRDGEVRQEYLSFYQKLSDEDRLMEEITFSGEDEIESKTLYEYDENGRVIKEMNYFEDEEFSDGRVLKYNKFDQLEEIHIQYADGSETIQLYERQPNLSIIRYFSEYNELEYTEERKTDEKNNLIEFIKFGPAKEVEHKIDLIYDEYGRLTESRDDNIMEDFRSVTRLDYDDKGNPSREIAYTEKGNIISSRQYEYNENNEVVKEIVNDYTISYEINDEGQRTERKVTNHSGQLEELTTYFHDEQGRIIEERFYKSNDLNSQDLFRTGYLRKRYVYQ
jgi:hypothetical protein